MSESEIAGADITTMRALPLASAIYEAATDPPRWRVFLERLSDELGGPAIAMSLMFPGGPHPSEYYRVHLDESYTPVFERYLKTNALPWGLTDSVFREGFGRGSLLFPDERIERTDYWREYMEPQGLAPEGPIAHLICAEDGRPVSGISVMRRQGGREVSDDDVALCNLLVPHLEKAHTIRRQLRSMEDELGALALVLDRIPTGIVLLGHDLAITGANRAGRGILLAGDGLSDEDGVLRATHARDRATLEKLLDGLIRPQGDARGGVAAISRRSAQRPYSVLAIALGEPVESGDEALAALFITDPTSGRTSLGETFRSIYGLTRAESQLVELLADGRSLEEISKERGVTMNTTRSQLKHVFAKTDTSRQGDVVRLALFGIAGLGDDPL